MASRVEIFSMFIVAEMPEPEGCSNSQLVDVNFDLLTTIADHSLAITDFQYPRGCFLGITIPCDDAMLCAMFCYLNILSMLFKCSLPIVGAAQILCEILEAALADGYRIAVP